MEEAKKAFLQEKQRAEKELPGFDEYLISLFNEGAEKPDAAELTTDTWEGTWECTGSAGMLILTIGGEGKSSNLRGHHPRAHGGRPADEVYTITKISAHSAEGYYVYYDTNPAKGSTGQSGVWTGTWSITIHGNEMELFRSDDSSSWSGTYVCRKK